MTTPITAQMGLDARNALLWIADQWPRLKAALIPGGGNGLNGMPRHPEEHPAPFDVHVSDLLFEIETEARALAHVLLDETDDWTPTTSAMPGLLREVAQRYGHWTSGDARTALAFLDWAEEYRGKVWSALERPAGPRYIGECPVSECDGELRLRDGQGAATCPECGTRTTLAEQLVYARGRFGDMLFTQSEILSALMILETPVKQSTLAKWVERGKLEVRVDMGGDGDLYGLAEAVDLAEKSYAWRASRSA